MIRTFLFTGDSNAVGYNTTAADLPPHLSTYVFQSTYVFTQGASYWGLMQPGVNTGAPNSPGAWSAEAQFAYRLEQAFPGDVNLIIKVAKGSTPIASIPGLDWHPGSVGEMFDVTDATIDSAAAAFLAAQGQTLPPLSATFVISGPNDASDLAQALAFQANLEALFAAARSDWGSSYIGFTRMTDPSGTPYDLEVRVAQWTVDQNDIAAESLKTIGFAMQDETHYAPIGLVSVGDGFFDSWAF